MPWARGPQDRPQSCFFVPPPIPIRSVPRRFRGVDLVRSRAFWRNPPRRPGRLFARKRRSPSLDVTIPTILDPALAPDGKHVLSAYVQFAPFKLKEGNWVSRRRDLGLTVINTLGAYAPDLSSLVEGMQVITPEDLETFYGFTGGHIFHGELALDQLFAMRPVLDWARYKTPVRGLFLCGSGTHPGNGLTGASGANAAREIIRELR